VPKAILPTATLQVHSLPIPSVRGVAEPEETHNDIREVKQATMGQEAGKTNKWEG
jgi:hypothetical protein